MKSIFKCSLCFLSIFLLFSCSDETTNETLKPPEIQTVEPLKRNTNNDPFYDLLYVYDILNIESGRTGTYSFVDDVMATLQNTADSESIYERLRAENTFPCWNCAESEFFEFHNYYIPFYELSTSRLDGILVAQEKNNEKKFYYLSKSVVDQIVAVRVEPYSQYWNGIMGYFDAQTYPQGRDEVFASSKLPCLLYNNGSSCGCPYINNQGQPSYWYCYVLDFLNDPCDTGKCPFEGTGGGNNGVEDLPFYDMGDWTSDDGDEDGKTNTSGTNTNNNNNNNNNSDPRPDWDDNCDSHDGSLSIGIILEEGGEIVIDESTGTIAIDELENLYAMQVTNFINDYALPFTPKELMDLIGEKCAVSNVQEVRNCLKCYFISPFGLSSSQSWELADNFDIIVDCESDPNPDCIECSMSLLSFTIKYGLELTADEEAIIMATIDKSSCGLEGFEEEAISAIVMMVTDFEIEDIVGKKIKLLDCSSFNWVQVGEGWVACLDPSKMDIQIGTTGVYFSIDLGCLSYTVPKTRLDSEGNIIQYSDYDQASSCASLGANLAAISVKLAIKLFPSHKLDTYLARMMLSEIYKQAFIEMMSDTDCGYGSIASCNSINCPGGTNPPIYSENFIEVTVESLLGGCH